MPVFGPNPSGIRLALCVCPLGYVFVALPVWTKHRSGLHGDARPQSQLWIFGLCGERGRQGQAANVAIASCVLVAKC